jgi:hypothetical protein
LGTMMKGECSNLDIDMAQRVACVRINPFL